MVVNPRSSDLSMVYSCPDCGDRFGADDRELRAGDERTACPLCGGELRQQNRVR